MIRGLAATAAGAAVVGAYLMRRWDRSAGRRVAEAASETARQEMKYEERIAELEADAEKASEFRGALNTRLRAKRAELARLRNEHAELLRRYATAETERASALEGRRRLALEAASPAKALEAAGSIGSVGSVGSAGSAGSVDSDDEPDEVPTGLPSAAAYAKADEALSRLRESARRQKERREQAAAAAAKAEAAERAPEQNAERDDRKGPHESRGKDGAATLGKPPAAGGQDGDGPQEPPAHARTAASAVVPYAAARRAASRSESGFDYFGTQKRQSKKQKREPEPAAEEDLADVIGDETLAETKKGAVGEVVDLTAHDETEQIDLGELRSAIS
ncbi:hypothetical protein [Streptomyces sp. MK37H]|uniref:hypothetical protein n=1 Tax=Streptomyces sp. MK37H TaxID=2699117 RepID=UPI0027E4A4D1|nr:hypothetical protein [Streptomyces sp. MK37H]MBP8534329.1 hypothetical protein [Streptomyces sp. MK37H]